MNKNNLSQLRIWNEAKVLMLIVDKLCQQLPSNERYILINQIKRSSLSVVSNIAEAHNSYYYKEKVRMGYIARKEAGETQSHILVMHSKEYISEFECDNLVNKYQELIMSINAYIRFYRQIR